jgi:hypothetical protein
VLGGGVSTSGEPTSLEILSSYPDISGQRWIAGVQNSGLTSIQVVVFAICANAEWTPPPTEPPPSEPPPSEPPPSEPPPYEPDCSKLNIVSWTWESGRFFIRIDDTNDQDGYLGFASVDFPNYVNSQVYYIDHIRWHPNDSDTSAFQVTLTNGNHAADWGDSFSEQSDSYRVSAGDLISRMSVNFGGDLFDYDLPFGDYSVSISVYYLGYSEVCSTTIARVKSSTLPTDTPEPPTEPPPTARD